MSHTALATTLNGHTKQVARAYAGIGKKRETYADLRAKVAELTAERDEYKKLWQATRELLNEKTIAFDELAKGRGLDKRNINARPIGSASELARLWEVGPDRITKWKQEDRLIPVGTYGAGKTKRDLFFLDVSKPDALPRGKRKNSSGSSGL